ncbi:MAG: hypothetical protein U0Y10_05030 [Spirosomataceae bacterium]
MKTIIKSLTFSLIAFLFLLTSCSKKDEVVLDPADQVVGTYNGTSYSETTNGVTQTYDLTSATFKDNVTIKLLVTRQTANTVKLDLTISQKDSAGSTQTSTDSLENVELVALSTGGFQLQNDSQTLGQVVNGVMTIAQTFPDTDSQGNAIQVTVKIVSQKASN